MFKLMIRGIVTLLTIAALTIIFRGLPASGAEVCVYPESAYFGTVGGTPTCIKNSLHSGASEGYTTLRCTAQQIVIFPTYIPAGPGKTFTAKAYVMSDDTGSGKICEMKVGVMSLMNHCLSTTPQTNDGTACNFNSDCPTLASGTPRTCRGGALDGAAILSDLATVSVTRTFVAQYRYESLYSSDTDVQRWGDDGASAWNEHNLDCDIGLCGGHVGRLYVALNTSGTTASSCDWGPICIQTP